MPKGTDPAIVAKFSAAVAKVVAESKDYAGEIVSFAQQPFYMDTKATTEHYAKELGQLMSISDQLRGQK
jgi:tripartite-type tricarboxylate transporter receptor subunit TctC